MADDAPPAAGAAAARAEMLAEMLVGDSGARRRAYTELETVDAAVAAEPVIAETLVASVLCSADVGAAEYRRAAELAGDLMLRSNGGFDLEFLRQQRIQRTFEAPTLVAVASKPPADLTREDVLVVASSAAVMLPVVSKGWTQMYARAGEDEMKFLVDFSETHPLLPKRAASNPDAGKRLTELMLDVLRDPQELSDRQLACAWFGLILCMTQREEEAAVAAAGGVFEIGAAEMRKRSPIEWVKWQSPSSYVVGGIFIAFTHTTIAMINRPGGNVIKLLSDSGAMESACAGLKALELHGASAVPEANVCLFFHILLVLQPVDPTSPDTQPIVEQLQQIPSSLKFVLEHNMDHIKTTGMTTAAQCAHVCALFFGKQEQGDGFEFSDEQVDLVLVFTKDMFDGSLAPWFQIARDWLRPVESLCISDANKMLLVKSSALVPLLLAALFLQGDHVRNVGSENVVSVDKDIKAAVQTDAANCFLQIAVFGPGRDMLANESAAIRALHVLADGAAFTAEAKLAAAGALMAIKGRTPEPQLELMFAEHGDEGKHVMVSYQWSFQVTIERIVRSLQSRGYIVWFDVDCMKGSTVDAMSSAIDNADVMLYGVSELYKESGNCRLEANYAHQQGVDMIPLLVEKGYRPNGWLGLIMGTRMYYSFYGESTDGAAFEKSLDAVVREIADRGKPVAKVAVSEGVPPKPEAVPARTLAPTSAPTVVSPLAPAPAPISASTYASAPGPASTSAPTTPPRSALVEVATGEQTCTPIMHLTSPAGSMPLAHGESPALIALLRSMEAKIEKLSSPREIISDAQLDALQTRLETLHAAQLLTEAELGCLEDCIADGIEATSTCEIVTLEWIQSSDVVSKLHNLIVLSQRMPKDAMFARQARRKFC